MEKSTSSVCALVALSLQANGHLEGKLNTANWSGLVTNGLWEENWLLAYEAGRRNWIAGHALVDIQADPHFNLLHANGIIFYDETISITPLIRKTAKIEDDVSDDEDYEFEHEDLNDYYF